MLVRLARIEDIPYIIHLANKESNAIGFIPKPAYEAAITGIKLGKRWSPVCNDRLWIAKENGQHVGFLLASFGNMARVTQIAIQEDARLLERGKALINALQQYSHELNIYDYTCGCADDLESNYFWQAMGWMKYGQRPGIHFETKLHSARPVNIWRYHELQTTLPLFADAGS